MPEYLLAFDIGTTGVKAGLFKPEGQIARCYISRIFRAVSRTTTCRAIH